MSHIDTLKVYKDAIAVGFTEDQAVYQATSLAEAEYRLESSVGSIDAVRRAELDYSISGVLHTIELLRKDFAGLKWMVLGMGALFAIPVIQDLFNFIKGLV
jgi:hypothetical protein